LTEEMSIREGGSKMSRLPADFCSLGEASLTSRRRRIVLRILVFGLCAFLGSTVAQGAVNRNAVDGAVKATVYLEVQRVYRGYDMSNAGSGLFVHPDGYILTNWHVVADQAWANWSGTERALSLTVVSITAVVDPGSTSEKRLPAKVIASDRKRDLALLKVAATASDWIDPASVASVGLMDEVVVIGFPFGDLLTFNEYGGISLEGTPEPSINIGRVTSLRRDQEDRIVAVQTDAAINPGNSGGPLIDTSGRLAGVVYAEIIGGNQIGFAIAPNRVHSFYLDQAVKVAFMPPYAPFPSAAVKLTVEPGILPLNATGGRLSIERPGLEPLVAELVETPFGWQAIFTLKTERPGASGAGSFLTTLRLFGAGGGQVFSRSFRLRVVESSSTGIAGNRDAAAIMGDRKLANKMSIQDYAQKHASERAASGETGTLIPNDPGQSEDEDLPTLEFTKPEPRDEPIPELFQDEVRRAKKLYQQGRFKDVVEVLEPIIEVDPANNVAWEYLQMARERVALENSRPKQYRKITDSAAMETEVVPVAPGGEPAIVDLRFMSQAEAGSIRLRIDDEELEPVVFGFKKKQIKSGSGAVEHTIVVEPGRRSLTVTLENKKGEVVASREFAEAFRSGTRWTLRINQYDSAQATEFFLIERRN